MTEEHSAQVEKTLLYISEARKRADSTARSLRAADAPAHLVEAVVNAAADLEALGRRLMQETYFATPDEQLSLDKRVEELTVSP